MLLIPKVCAPETLYFVIWQSKQPVWKKESVGHLRGQAGGGVIYSCDKGESLKVLKK